MGKSSAKQQQHQQQDRGQKTTPTGGHRPPTSVQQLGQVAEDARHRRPSKQYTVRQRAKCRKTAVEDAENPKGASRSKSKRQKKSCGVRRKGEARRIALHKHPFTGVPCDRFPMLICMGIGK